MQDRISISSLPARMAGRRIDPSRFEDLRPPLIMGVLNVTPDSFSDGGRFLGAGPAVERGLSMVDEGADIIDIGGESSRPFAESVTVDEEISRVLPVVRELSERTDVPISVDTRHPAVARPCLEAGASIVNDIYGLREEGMERLVAESGASAVIMHMKGLPKDMQVSPRYDDVVSEVFRFLTERVDRMASLGVGRDRLFVDPGIGFGKTVHDNLRLIRDLGRLKETGCRIVLGTSRKSFIGKVLRTDDPMDRLEGSISSMLAGVSKGASVLRVHDVRASRRALSVHMAIEDPTGFGSF